MFLDDKLTIAILKGFPFKKQEVVNRVSFNQMKEVNLINKTLTITYEEHEKTSKLAIEFIQAEESKDVEQIIKKQLAKREARAKRIEETVAITKNIGLASNAVFSLALCLDKKCNWQKAREEHQKLVGQVQALSNMGLDLDNELLEQIKTAIEEREPERAKVFILDFIKDSYRVVVDIKETEPLGESPNRMDLKRLMEFLLLAGTLNLILRRGLIERAEELAETIIRKLSELEPLIDKQCVNKIIENIKSSNYETMTEITKLLVDGLKAESRLELASTPVS